MIKAIDELLRPQKSDAPAHPASEELRLAREALNTEIHGVFRSLKRALYVEKRVLGLTMFDAGYRLAGFAAVTLSGLAISLVATLLLVASVRRGLQVLTQDAWWSDLILAVVLLALLFGAAPAYRRFIHRSTLAETRRELNRTDVAHPTEPTR